MCVHVYNKLIIDESTKNTQWGKNTFFIVWKNWK